MGHIMENFMEWLGMFETKHIVGYVTELDLLHDPWFIAGAILFIVVSLFLKWHLLLSCTLSLGGMIALVTFIHQRGTSLDNSSDSLFMFIGGGGIIVFFMIYMVFLRSE
jgi:hypothetical protein